MLNPKGLQAQPEGPLWIGEVGPDEVPYQRCSSCGVSKTALLHWGERVERPFGPKGPF